MRESRERGWGDSRVRMGKFQGHPSHGMNPVPVRDSQPCSQAHRILMLRRASAHSKARAPLLTSAIVARPVHSDEAVVFIVDVQPDERRVGAAG